MSYCVHCGVELDKSCGKCPLCNTPVVDPTHPLTTTESLPYPTIKGHISPVKRSDTAILLSVILISTGLACGLLNLFVFKQTLWSLYIIGVCIVFWIFFTPALIYRKLSYYLHVFFDGSAVSLYLFLIAIQFRNHDWFYQLALPIVGLVIFTAELLGLCYRTLSKSILFISVYVVAGVAIVCVGIELLVRHYLLTPLALTWSAVVLTSCIIIIITLITILAKSRLREEVRRRMHI